MNNTEIFEILQDFVIEKGGKVVLKSDMWDAGGKYYSELKRIELNKCQPANLVLSALIHETAHFIDFTQFNRPNEGYANPNSNYQAYISSDIERLAHYVEEIVGDYVKIPYRRIPEYRKPEGLELEKANKIINIMETRINALYRGETSSLGIAKPYYSPNRDNLDD